MKNILATTVVSMSMFATAQVPKNTFQYEQEIIHIFQKAVESGKADQNALPMEEGNECYEFLARVDNIERQVYYCLDTKKGFIQWGEARKNVNQLEGQGLLDAIQKKYEK